MKVDLLSIEGKKLKIIELPPQFNEPYHPNLIKRTVLTILNNLRQPYGVSPEAGKRASAKLSRRRRQYRGAYGHGISRVPRKALWSRGRRFGWVGAFAPGTVGGRKAHPPTAEKIWEKKINKKERRKAIRSAIAATSNKILVKERGHLFELELPIIVESKLEQLSKTKEIKAVLENLGLKKELQRTLIKKIRAGKGKTRGRKYKKKKGPLIVASKNCPLIKAAINIPGVETCLINSLNTNLLAPGAVAGRLTIYTQDSIDKLRTNNLFLDTEKVARKSTKKTEIEGGKEK